TEQAEHVAADSAALARCVTEMEEVLLEGDALKFVPAAASTADGLRVLRLLRQRGGGLIAFASGAAGSFTRVLAPIFGSPFTYAAPSPFPGTAPQPTAPGQLSADELHGHWPPGGPTPGTAIYGVLGQPLTHSLSPFVQGMALKAAHLDALYLAFECADLAALLELADDENFRGFSVTAPHKRAALAAAVSSDEASRAAGAANTLVREGRAWRAANTDIPAIAETLEEAATAAAGTVVSAAAGAATEVAAGVAAGAADGKGQALAGRTALVIGAGGAARAAAVALLRAGAEVTIAARQQAAAKALGEELGCSGVLFSPDLARNAGVIVHTTPVGTVGMGGTGGTVDTGGTSGTGDTGGPDDLGDTDGTGGPALSRGADEEAAETSLLAPEHMTPGALVLDAVYSPRDTALLRAAAQAGAIPISGGEWFLRQAALQFQLFTGQEANKPLLRAALGGALERAARTDRAATATAAAAAAAGDN
ncbi:MAG: type I 3-dehydroquinate dehydratase, partial [Planctomycetota bacterium]|nr:type I 3-dehydroquinate dehydratase [Planctomycetota bacterium]